MLFSAADLGHVFIYFLLLLDLMNDFLQQEALSPQFSFFSVFSHAFLQQHIQRKSVLKYFVSLDFKKHKYLGCTRSHPATLMETC